MREIIFSINSWGMYFLIIIISIGIVPTGIVFAITTFIDSFDVSGQETSPQGVAFNTDGTKLFVIGNDGDDVNEYACTTGFDVSTCTFSGAGEVLDVSGQDGGSRDLAFNTDGTKLFVIGTASDDVNEYACTTGFDVSTCTFSGAGEVLDVSGNGNPVFGIAFNTDGTKLFLTGPTGDAVNEYACTTGFDVSTCTYSGDAERLDVSAEEGGPTGIAFNTDGTKLFVIGFNGDDVNEYACTTGFDVSTCAYSGDGKRLDVSGQETNPSGLAFNTDGTKLFVIGTSSDAVHEYTLEIGFDFISSLSSSSGSVKSNNRGGTGGCFDCVPPTLGIDQNGKRVVDYGFSYNGNPVQVKKYHTPFPLITVNIGEENIAELIVYENRGERMLTHVGLAFGLNSDQHFGDSPAIIEWDRDLSGIETVIQTDPNNVIDDDSLRIESSKVKCTEDGKEDRCTLLKIFHKFRNILDFNIVKTYVWDLKRNGWQNTYNDGVRITGDSLNSPIQHKVKDKKNLIFITETDKNTAVDENGNTWRFDKIWTKDYNLTQCTDTFSNNGGIDRNNCKFNTYKQGQQFKAIETMKNIFPKYFDPPFQEINNIFKYE